MYICLSSYCRFFLQYKIDILTIRIYYKRYFIISWMLKTYLVLVVTIHALIKTNYDFKVMLLYEPFIYLLNI